MADFILITGDQAIYQPNFGQAVVVVSPGTLTGSGPGSINGEEICVLGDEASAKVEQCPYTAGQYAGGFGTLSVKRFTEDNVASKTRSGKTKVMLKGGTYDAEFTVTTQGISTADGSPDPTPMYSNGKISFVNTNTKCKGT